MCMYMRAFRQLQKGRAYQHDTLTCPRGYMSTLIATRSHMEQMYALARPEWMDAQENLVCNYDAMIHGRNFPSQYAYASRNT